MKATEIFVEQLLIGALVGVAVVLAFGDWRVVSDALVRDDATGSATMWVLAGLGVGGAYLLGVLMDRFADSLLAPLNRHWRLRFALSHDGRDPSVWPPGFDPFDQKRLETAVRRKGNDLGDWLHYLRSRIRLTRALAVFLPGLTFALVLDLQDLERTWLAVALPAGYLLAAVGSLFSPGPPRTDGNREEVEQYWITRRLRKSEAVKTPRDRAFDAGWLALDVLSCSAVRLGVVLLGVAFTLALDCLRDLGVVLAGALLTLLAGWSWWRISNTMMSFLVRSGEPA